MKMSRVCSICDTDFESDVNRMYYCPKCEKEYKKNYYEKNKEKIKSRFIAIETPDQKECSKCKTVLPASCFYRDTSKKSGLSSSCKDCKKKN